MTISESFLAIFFWIMPCPSLGLKLIWDGSKILGTGPNFLNVWRRKKNEVFFRLVYNYMYQTKFFLVLVKMYFQGKQDITYQSWYSWINLRIFNSTALYCAYLVDIAGMTAVALHCTGLCLKEGGHNTWQFSEIVCLDQIINSHQFRVNLADIGDTFKGPQANFNPCYMHWSYYIYRVFRWFIENSLKFFFYLKAFNKLLKL